MAQIMKFIETDVGLKMRIKRYMHLIGDKPAYFDGWQIVYASTLNKVSNFLVDDLEPDS